MRFLADETMRVELASLRSTLRNFGLICQTRSEDFRHVRDQRARSRSRVASGEYASASDYLSDLVLRDQPLSAEDAKWREKFLSSIDRGIADSNAGRVTDADVVLAELTARYAAMEESNGR